MNAAAQGGAMNQQQQQNNNNSSGSSLQQMRMSTDPMDCQKMLSEMDLEQSYKLRFLVSSDSAGKIIGKGGESVKQIRANFDCGVQIPNTDSPERVLTVSGKLGKCFEACEEILAKTQKDQSGTFEIRLLVHHSQAGAVIGTKGLRIKQLRTEHDCQVRCFPSKCPGSTDRIVRIAGTEKDNALTVLKLSISLCLLSPPRGQVQEYDANFCDPALVSEYGGIGSENSLNRSGGQSFSAAQQPPLSAGQGGHHNFPPVNMSHNNSGGNPSFGGQTYAPAASQPSAMYNQPLSTLNMPLGQQQQNQPAGGPYGASPYAQPFPGASQPGGFPYANGYGAAGATQPSALQQQQNPSANPAGAAPMAFSPYGMPGNNQTSSQFGYKPQNGAGNSNAGVDAAATPSWGAPNSAADMKQMPGTANTAPSPAAVAGQQPSTGTHSVYSYMNPAAGATNGSQMTGGGNVYATAPGLGGGQPQPSAGNPYGVAQQPGQAFPAQQQQKQQQSPYQANPVAGNYANFAQKAKNKM